MLFNTWGKNLSFVFVFACWLFYIVQVMHQDYEFNLFTLGDPCLTELSCGLFDFDD